MPERKKWRTLEIEDQETQGEMQRAREAGEVARMAERAKDEAREAAVLALRPIREYAPEADELVAGDEVLHITKSRRKTINGQKLLALGVALEIITEATEETEYEVLKFERKES